MYVKSADQRNVVKQRSLLNEVKQNRTLFISGIKSTVSKNKIRAHFIDCIKVTVKEYYTTSKLKYDIYVLHISYKENVFHTIDMLLFFTVHKKKPSVIFIDT